MIDIFERFVFDARVDLHQRRFIVDQVKDFLPREIVAACKPGKHLADEFQILGSIDRPTVIAKIGGVV